MRRLWLAQFFVFPWEIVLVPVTSIRATGSSRARGSSNPKMGSAERETVHFRQERGRPDSSSDTLQSRSRWSVCSRAPSRARGSPSKKRLLVNKDSASDTSSADIVPARTGTWDWGHSPRQSQSRWPSIVEMLQTRNSWHRHDGNCNRRTTDRLAPQRAFRSRR